MAALFRFWRLRRTHPVRFFVLVFGLALLLAGGERLAGSLRSRLSQPVRGACWIWASGDHGSGEPIAFYAARDVELDELGPAEMVIVADETYLLYVNGRRVGAGSYRFGSSVDEYELSDRLELGVNRILVELRSSRGAGGLLAGLELGGDEGKPRRVVTDADWRIFRSYDPGLLGGWSSLDGGEAPEVWQRGPTGRWRSNGDRRLRVVAREGFPPPRRVRPVRFQQQHSDEWRELAWAHSRIPALGPQQVFDWGEVVEGVLSFDLISDQGLPGLLYFGDELPDPETRPPDEILLPVPGRRHWEDAHSRRFRYLLLVGGEPYSRIEVTRLDQGAPPAPAPNHRGVFGLAPPRSYSKVEEDVWGSLEQRVKDKQERQRAVRNARRDGRP